LRKKLSKNFKIKWKNSFLRKIFSAFSLAEEIGFFLDFFLHHPDSTSWKKIFFSKNFKNYFSRKIPSLLFLRNFFDFQ